MSLYIILNSGKQLQWSVQQNIDKVIDIKEICDISYIQADGHELTHILDKFTLNKLNNPQITIPAPSGVRIVRWFGDIAKTIIGNI